MALDASLVMNKTFCIIMARKPGNWRKVTVTDGDVYLIMDDLIHHGQAGCPSLLQ